MSTNTFDLKNSINPIIPGTISDADVDTGMSSALKINAAIAKLNNIKEGAEPNLVMSVSGKRGDVVLEKGDVGLNNVDNTTDLDKPISTLTKEALDLKLDKSIWDDIFEQRTRFEIKKSTNITGELFINDIKVDPNKKVENLDDINDVSVILPGNGQVLTWLNDKWVNSNTDIVGIAHTHDNKTVLDSISAEDINNWNNNINAASYLKDLLDVSIIAPKEGLFITFDSNLNKWRNSNKPSYTFNEVGALSATDSRIENWNTAFSSAHTHDNKALLDSITTSDVLNWKDSYNWGNHANAGYSKQVDLTAHVENRNNPHEVTITQIGALGVNAIAADSNKLGGAVASRFIRDKGSINLSEIDNISTNGIYNVLNGNDMYRTLVVFNNGSGTHSLLMQLWGGYGENNLKYRLKNNTSWDSWKTIWHNHNFDPSTKADKSVVDSHIGNKVNPHDVTKALVGLGNVDNTSDLNKPISNSTQAALNLKLDKSIWDGIFEIVKDGIKVKGNLLASGDVVSYTNTGIEGGGGGGGGLITKVYSISSLGTALGAESLTETFSAKAIQDIYNRATTTATDLNGHKVDRNNPHGVTYTQVGAAPAAHDHARLLSTDKRDVKPNNGGTANEKVIKPFFTALSTFGLDAYGNYGDFLLLDTYSDNTGGKVNGIVLGKNSSSPEMFIVRSDWNGSSWTETRRVYHSGNINIASVNLSGNHVFAWGNSNWAAKMQPSGATNEALFGACNNTDTTSMLSYIRVGVNKLQWNPTNGQNLYDIWHAGNFDPNSKLGKTEKAADSDKLDGLDYVRFLRSIYGAAIDANTVDDMTIAKTSINYTNSNLPDTPNNRTAIITIKGYDTNYKNQIFLGNGNVWNRTDNGSWKKFWDAGNLNRSDVDFTCNDLLPQNIRMPYGSNIYDSDSGKVWMRTVWDSASGFGDCFEIRTTGNGEQLALKGGHNGKLTWGGSEIFRTSNLYANRINLSKSQSSAMWYMLGATANNHFNGFTAIVTGMGVASGGMASTYIVSAHSINGVQIRKIGNIGNYLEFGVVDNGYIKQVWIRSKSAEFTNITITEEHTVGGASVYTRLDGANPTSSGITPATVLNVWDGFNSNTKTVDWNCKDLKAIQGHFENNINGVNSALVLRNNFTSSVSGTEYSIGSDIQFRHHQDNIGASIKFRSNAYFGTSHLYLECTGGITLQNNTSVSGHRLVIGSSTYGTSETPNNYDLAFRGHFGGDYARIRSVEQSGTSAHGTMQFFVRGYKGSANTEPDLVMSLTADKQAVFERDAIAKGNLITQSFSRSTKRLYIAELLKTPSKGAYLADCGQFAIESYNNAMCIGVDGSENTRQGWIQVGHQARDYSSYYGRLFLNPMGGNVSVGNTDPRQRFDVDGVDSAVIIGRTSRSGNSGKSHKLRLALATTEHIGSEYWSFSVDDNVSVATESMLRIGYGLNNTKLSITANGNVGVNTTVSLIDLAIGDSDTGFDWISDGYIKAKANNVDIFAWTSSELATYKTVNMNQKLIFDNRGIFYTNAKLNFTEQVVNVGDIIPLIKGTSLIASAGYRQNALIALQRTGHNFGDLIFRLGTSDTGTSWSEFRFESGGSFKVDGNIYAKGEIVAYSTSDKRFKKDVKKLNNCLEFVNKLNPVSYKWNEKAKEILPHKTDDRDFGLIAQELEKIKPELVHDLLDDYKSIDYVKLVPFLIGAIQELNNKINKLCQYQQE